MTTFLSDKEKKISKEFDDNGFIVKDIKDLYSSDNSEITFLHSIKSLKQCYYHHTQ